MRISLFTKKFNNRNLKKFMILHTNHIVITNVYKVFESKISVTKSKIE